MLDRSLTILDLFDRERRDDVQQEATGRSLTRVAQPFLHGALPVELAAVKLLIRVPVIVLNGDSTHKE